MKPSEVKEPYSSKGVSGNWGSDHDVIVNEGVTLTLEPGVMFRATAQSDFLGGGGFPDKVELVVRGTLRAIGTTSDSVTFTSTGESSWDWVGLVLEPGATATIGTAVIEHAGNAVELKNANLTISGCRITNTSVGIAGAGDLSECSAIDVQIHPSYAGVSITSGQVHLRRISVFDGKRGIHLETPTEGEVQECFLRGPPGAADYGLRVPVGVSTTAQDTLDPKPTIVTNHVKGVILEAGASLRNVVAFRNYEAGITSEGGAVSVSYCTAVDNFWDGINILSGTVVNSIATNNQHQGVVTTSPGLINHTNSWMNGTRNFSGETGANIASFDPFYEDPAARDYRLQDSSLFKSFSSTGGEIGAYGPGPGLPVQVKRQTTWGRVKSSWR